jgi:opacity protein-like surface antigen
MSRFAVIAACIALLALAAAPASHAADVQVPDTSDVFTGETATANQTIESLLSCSSPVLSTVLRTFGDARSYFPAPGANFESSLTGWKLTGGATAVGGNESFHVLGARDAASLRLPAGSSATSPAFCADLDYPTFRFFVRQLQQSAPAGLEVDVIYPDITKNNVRLAANVNTKGASDWSLAKDVPLKPKTAGKDAGWRRVALRFRVAANAGADWRVDDVLVDPACRY